MQVDFKYDIFTYNGRWFRHAYVTKHGLWHIEYYANSMWNVVMWPDITDVRALTKLVYMWRSNTFDLPLDEFIAKLGF